MATKTIVKFSFSPLLIILLASPTLATDLTVFGIKIGEPLAIAECQKGDLGVKICATKKGTKAWGVMSIAINMPTVGRPNYLKSFSVGVIDDNVENIVIVTNGFSVQDEVLNALISKYGSPKTLDKIPVQNVFNAQYLNYRALWTFPDLTVVFDGIHQDINWGRVEVFSPKYDKFMKEWEIKSKANKLKL